MNLQNFLYLHGFTPEHQEIFRELCRRVGTLPECLKLKKGEKDNWDFPYDAYEWTLAEEKDFQEWLLNYVYKHRGHFGFSGMSKKTLMRKFIPFWILSYSWKYKKEESKDEKKL